MNRISDRIEALRRFYADQRHICIYCAQYQTLILENCTCSLGITEMDFPDQPVRPVQL